MLTLLQLYANALREIAEVLATDHDDAVQTALEIATDALTHAEAAPC